MPENLVYSRLTQFMQYFCLKNQRLIARTNQMKFTVKNHSALANTSIQMTKWMDWNECKPTHAILFVS